MGTKKDQNFPEHEVEKEVEKKPLEAGKKKTFADKNSPQSDGNDNLSSETKDPKDIDTTSAEGSLGTDN